MNKKFFSAKNVTTLGVLLALVILLQFFGSNFKIGATTLSLVLVPVVLGGILLGPLSGGILGFAFSAVVTIMGFVGTDPFTNALFSVSAWGMVGTLLLIFIKGIAAGVVPSVLYKIISKKNKFWGVIVASVCAPIINTGIFIIGMLILSDVLSATGFITDGQTVLYFLVIGCAGVNFLIELAINAVLSPAIYRVITTIKREKSGGGESAVSTENVVNTENEKDDFAVIDGEDSDGKVGNSGESSVINSDINNDKDE